MKDSAGCPRLLPTLAGRVAVLVLLAFGGGSALADASLPGGIPLCFPTADNPAPDWWAAYGATAGFPASSNAIAEVWQLRQMVFAVSSYLEDETDGHFGNYYFRPSSADDVLGALMDDASYDDLDDHQAISLGLACSVWCNISNIFANYAAIMEWIPLQIQNMLLHGGNVDAPLPIFSGQLQFLLAFSFNNTQDSFYGIPDWWMTFFGIYDANLDSDGDGLTTYDEYLLGTNPHDVDSDHDGIGDALDNAQFTDLPWVDADGDGIPDFAEERLWGTTGTVDNIDYIFPNGFSLRAVLATGNTNLVSIVPSQPQTIATDLIGIELMPPLPTTLPSIPTEILSDGDILCKRTVRISRHGSFEQYFISFSEDASSICMIAEWEDSNHESGAITNDAAHYPAVFQIPVSPDAETLTFRFGFLPDGSAPMDFPVRLYAYAPVLTVDSAHAATDGVTYYGGLAEDGVTILADRSNRPSSYDIPTQEELLALPFDLPPAATASLTSGDDILVSGLPAGIYPLQTPVTLADPAVLCGPMRAPPHGGNPLPAGTSAALLVFDPVLSYGEAHRRDRSHLAYDPVSGVYSRVKDWPLSTSALWESFHTSSTECPCPTCVPVFHTGLEGILPDCVHAECSASPATETATGVIRFDESEFCRRTALHERAESKDVDPLSDDGGCDCECVSCSDLEGADLGCLQFRIPLGIPRSGQVSGFVWFSLDALDASTPNPSPTLFEVLARPDADVADTMDGSARVIACSDERGKTLRIEPYGAGVKITVTDSASGALDHTWEVLRDGDRSFLLRKTSRLGNTMSCETFSDFGQDGWVRTDYLSLAFETLQTEDRLDTEVK